jgi:hypothetical protein
VGGIISLVLASKVRQYIVTDQDHILKHLRQNIADNLEHVRPSGPARQRRRAEPKPQLPLNIVVRPLDWETDSVANLYHDLDLHGDEQSIDLIISCDCIYNEALVTPLVNTFRDICSLAPASKPTICVIAQQLRSPEVFEAWLTAFHKHFHVWRIPDEHLIDELKEESGFILHVGILQSQ